MIHVNQALQRLVINGRGWGTTAIRSGRACGGMIVVKLVPEDQKGRVRLEYC